MEHTDNTPISEALLRTAEEFCFTIEKCTETERNEFVEKMTEVLPALYLHTASFSEKDSDDSMLTDGAYDYLDEQSYENIRARISVLLGEHDTFLETFEEDMKYSDTPIAATISESLADIFQPVYNFLCAIKDADNDRMQEIASGLKENFREYWSQTLCNVMRPLNALRYDIHEKYQ